MEQFKHTPGPWSYRYWSNCSDRNLLEGYSISADGHIVPMNTSEGDLYEAEANARLIAAAPELLEALKAAQKKGSRWHPADPVVQQINVAIAKATGA